MAFSFIIERPALTPLDQKYLEELLQAGLTLESIVTHLIYDILNNIDNLEYAMPHCHQEYHDFLCETLDDTIVQHPEINLPNDYGTRLADLAMEIRAGVYNQYIPFMKALSLNPEFIKLKQSGEPIYWDIDYNRFINDYWVGVHEQTA